MAATVCCVVRCGDGSVLMVLPIPLRIARQPMRTTWHDDCRTMLTVCRHQAGIADE
jgi:hypothetical protein